MGLRRAGTTAVAVLALLAGTAASETPPPWPGVTPDDDPYAVPEDALRTTHWSFEVPEGHAGPLVAGVAFDYGTENECDLHAWLSGTDSGVPIIYWSEAHSPERSFGGGFTSTLTAQAHTTQQGVDVDSRDLVDPGGVWSTDSHTRGPFSGVERRLWAVHHAEAWTREATGYHPPMLLELTCDQEFAVWDTSLGGEVHGVSDDTMDEGTGASVNQLLGRVTYSDGERWSADVDDERMAFRLRARATNSQVQGELRLTGAGQDLVHPLDGNDDLALGLEAGRLDLELDRVSAGLSDRFQVVVFSHRGVEDLATAYAERFG